MQGLEDKNIQVFKRLRKLATFANACMGGGGESMKIVGEGRSGGVSNLICHHRQDT